MLDDTLGAWYSDFLETANTEMENKMTYIVMTSSAKMPASVKSAYRNVAVVEIENDFVGTPAMISTHARGVKCIEMHFGPQFVGITGKCAYKRTLEEANKLAAKLNVA